MDDAVKYGQTGDGTEQAADKEDEEYQQDMKGAGYEPAWPGLALITVPESPAHASDTGRDKKEKDYTGKI